MTPGGALAAEVVLRDRVVAEARIVSTRRVPLAAALRGKPATDAVALVPLLFATCGIAHGVAALDAVESATGRADSAPVEARRERAWARELLVATEIADGHCWSILVDWPRVFGEPLVTSRLRALREATAAVRDAIDPARTSLRTGAGAPPGSRSSQDGVAAGVARLDALVREIVGELPDDVADLGPWAGRSSSPAASFVGRLLETASAAVGRSDVPPLPVLDADWFAARLSADAMFGERPTFDGAPCEAGPLSRAAGEPLVRSVISVHGRGALARVAARLVELARAPARLSALAEAGVDGVDVATAASVAGCGVADTARGRLAHWAVVEKGVVVDWRFVAPTEWTFHPEGAFPRGLVGASSTDAARAIQLHIAALDPCVPCRVTVRDAEAG